ncbi:hypothetical protein [Streptococcus cuniculi]|nr:hypothetical protein [Streptococcus cuniculi]MBF0777469.1 hypothetical protein [Streptococcus cuniculi]
MNSQDKFIESLTKMIEVMSNELALLREQVDTYHSESFGNGQATWA